jgi:Rgg/GadR/MutR family transcriptional activator
VSHTFDEVSLLPLGSTFRSLRQSRGLSMSQVANGIISTSGLGKFEREEGSIGLEKFLPMLNRMNMTMSEFMYHVNHYKWTPFIHFFDQLTDGVSQFDVIELQRLFSKELAAITEPNNPLDQHWLNSIAAECAIALIDDDQPPLATHVTAVMDYLMGITNWMQYDLYLAGFVAYFAGPDVLEYVADTIFAKVLKYKDIMDNGEKTTEIVLNILAIFLSVQRLDEANDLIQRIEHTAGTRHLTDHTFRFENLKAVYQYLIGNTDEAKDTFQWIIKSMQQLHLNPEIKFIIKQREDIIGKLPAD